MNDRDGFPEGAYLPIEHWLLRFAIVRWLLTVDCVYVSMCLCVYVHIHVVFFNPNIPCIESLHWKCFIWLCLLEFLMCLFVYVCMYLCFFVFMCLCVYVFLYICVYMFPCFFMCCHMHVLSMFVLLTFCSVLSCVFTLCRWVRRNHVPMTVMKCNWKKRHVCVTVVVHLAPYTLHMIYETWYTLQYNFVLCV